MREYSIQVVAKSSLSFGALIVAEIWEIFLVLSGFFVSDDLFERRFKLLLDIDITLTIVEISFFWRDRALSENDARNSFGGNVSYHRYSFGLFDA